jgi:hypothetical protein
MLEESGAEHEVAAAVLRLHADRMALVTRQRRLARSFTAAHPDVPVAEIPARAVDVHDLPGLRDIAASW